MDEQTGYEQVPAQPRVAGEPTNGLGIAGFVCSLVGLCAGGLLSPVGLILSLIALGREPRGFAIAGVVLGALGSCGFLPLLAVIFVLPGLAVALGLAGFIAAFSPELNARWEMAQLSHEVSVYEQANNRLPETLEELTIDPSRSGVFTDEWGNAYVYELIDGSPGYRILSTGPDGQIGTPDDIVADPEWKIDVN